MSDEIVVKDGNLYGPWLPAINYAADMKDTIHTDEMGKKAGMRGGVVVGTHHLDLFPPLLLRAFGPRWAERGSLSMYYTYALLDGEERRAVMALPPEGAKDAQVKAWVETPDGKTVETGTAAVGDPKELSYLMSQELVDARREDILILTDMHTGDSMGTHDILLTPADVGDNPGGIVAPSYCYHIMRVGEEDPTMKYNQGGKETSFFGATEIRNVDGPIRAGVPYRTGGKIACVGASAKTEFFWFDSWLEEKDTGKRVAECRHMSRFMKQASAAYGNA